MDRSTDISTDILITEQGTTRIGEYEPGNGTRYTAVAVPWTNGYHLSMGALGVIDEGYLVVSGNTARAYLLRPGNHFVDDYLQKHFGGLVGDYPYMGDLIRALVGTVSVGNQEATQ